jgi:hypothetical protein
LLSRDGETPTCSMDGNFVTPLSPIAGEGTTYRADSQQKSSL